MATGAPASTTGSDQCSEYISSSGEPSPAAAPGGTMGATNADPEVGKEDSLALLNRSPDAQSVKRMRRNESAAAALQSLGHAEASAAPVATEAPGAAGGMRKNKSYLILREFEQSEMQPPQAEATRSLVCEACALHLAALMQPNSGEPPIDMPAIILAMQKYIETICRQLSLPNSCIITMVIYLERLMGNPNFALTEQNWQPSVLSGFVVAAKLCFDEPVWNEDFLRALRISNVQVRQISRWEVNFLKLIDFNTNVELSDYADLTFRLQERFLKERGERVHFFSFLMRMCQTQR
eukprot:scaffold2645_cov112-Isochrysis_galbana.AAC.14